MPGDAEDGTSAPAGRDLRFHNRSQFGTWHRQPSQPGEADGQPVAGGPFRHPDREQSDARQQRLSLPGVPIGLPSGLSTAQLDAPAVSSSPPEPSAVSWIPLREQPPSAGHVSNPRQVAFDQQREDSVAGLQHDASTQAPDAPASPGLRGRAHTRQDPADCGGTPVPPNGRTSASGIPADHSRPGAAPVPGELDSENDSPSHPPYLAAGAEPSATDGHVLWPTDGANPAPAQEATGADRLQASSNPFLGKRSRYILSSSGCSGHDCRVPACMALTILAVPA